MFTKYYEWTQVLPLTIAMHTSKKNGNIAASIMYKDNHDIGCGIYFHKPLPIDVGLSIINSCVMRIPRGERHYDNPREMIDRIEKEINGFIALKEREALEALES